MSPSNADEVAGDSPRISWRYANRVHKRSKPRGCASSNHDYVHEIDRELFRIYHDLFRKVKEVNPDKNPAVESRMNRLLVELDADGGVRIFRHFAEDGEPTAVWQGTADNWPIEPRDLEELRWYVEDYLSYPYGADADRGQKIGERLRGWGEALFRALFGAGPARDAYLKVRDGGDGREFLVRSDDVELLRLPWELIWDPQQNVPIALSWDGFGRSLMTPGDSAHLTMEGERLRVLMVVARPAGIADVGYQIIARPLLEQLNAANGQVDLEVLRPPTFATMQSALRTAVEQGKPYRLVHFDGHGSLESQASRRGGPSAQPSGEAAEARLIFEHPDGGPDAVPASQFAAAVTGGRVPVAVLNACESGAMGERVEAALATRLLAAGVGAVVAMSYRVYARPAAEFMRGFYDALFEGCSVACAVRTGRWRLFDQQLRISPKGPLALQDWMVPVVYSRANVAFPNLTVDKSASEPPQYPQSGLRPVEETEGAGSWAPVDGIFVGRDRAFYELESATRASNPIVVYGPGGMGKTELVKAFGRWRQATGALDHDLGLVFVSFQPGHATLDAAGVISTIGGQLFGHTFSLRPADQQRAEVVDTVRHHRLLVVWDNFETVRTMPASTGALDEAEQHEVRRLLAELTGPGSRSVVLITSRTREHWLGDARRVQLGGLDSHEVDAYAEALLTGRPSARRHREHRTYKDGLLPFLAGHPLSLRIVLPQLEHTSPAQLLAGLQGQSASLPPGFEPDDDRNASLAASVAYSLAHLEPQHRERLPALTLFQGVADADVLGVMAGHEKAPARFAKIDADAWRQLLKAAEDFGLLTGLGKGMFLLHPSLPAYLVAEWANSAADNYTDERRRTEEAMVDAYATFGDWLRTQFQGGDARLAFSLIKWHGHTMSFYLGRALDAGAYKCALEIIEPLNETWKGFGLTDEANRWLERIRKQTESDDGSPPSLATEAGALWLFAVGSQGIRNQRAGMLDAAEACYNYIRRLLENEPDSEQVQQRLGVAYHNLGMVAQLRSDLGKARSLYIRAREIRRRLEDDQLNLAATDHQLGSLALQAKDLDEADRCFRRSLRLFEKLGTQPALAGCHYGLGNIAEERGDVDEAQRRYLLSLEIAMKVPDPRQVALTMLQLGTLEMRQRRYDEADRWYRQGLAIFERLRELPRVGEAYRSLGFVALERGDLTMAELWCDKALSIFEELGQRRLLAATYAQRGQIAERGGDLTAGLRWVVRGLALYEDLSHPDVDHIVEYLERLAQALGLGTLFRVWRDETGDQLPETLATAVRATSRGEN